MSYRRMIAASGLTALVLAGVAGAALHRLPPGATLPTHWNAAGEVDRVMDAATALFGPVLVSLGVSALFAVLPRLEPLQHRLDKSAALLVAAWAATLGVLAVGEAMVAGPAFGFHPPATLPLAAAGVVLMVIGNALPKSRPGFFVGIRTPWTITDADNWVATHRLGAWTFIAGGLLIVAAALLPLPGMTRYALLIAALVGAIVPPVVWSSWLWRLGKVHTPDTGSIHG